MACVNRIDPSEYEVGDKRTDQYPNKSREESENQSHMFKNFDSELGSEGQQHIDCVFHRLLLFFGSPASTSQSAYSPTSSGTRSFS
jgi:hypothetical protein